MNLARIMTYMQAQPEDFKFDGQPTPVEGEPEWLKVEIKIKASMLGTILALMQETPQVPSTPEEGQKV